jgi:hypothetical protein
MSWIGLSVYGSQSCARSIRTPHETPDDLVRQEWESGFFGFGVTPWLARSCASWGLVSWVSGQKKHAQHDGPGEMEFANPSPKTMGRFMHDGGRRGLAALPIQLGFEIRSSMKQCRADSLFGRGSSS